MTPEQEKAVLDAVAQIPNIATTLGTVAQKSEEAFGFVKRLDGEIRDLKKAPPPAPDKPPDKPVADPTAATVKAELDAVNKKLADRDKRIAIGDAFRDVGIKWEDAAYVQDKLTAAVVEENGQFVVKAKQKLKETGNEIDVTQTPAEWLKSFAAERPKLVASVVRDGSGAGGEPPAKTDRNVDELFGSLTHADLMKDPKRYTAAMRADPGRMKKLQDAADAARQKKK